MAVAYNREINPDVGENQIVAAPQPIRRHALLGDSCKIFGYPGSLTTNTLAFMTRQSFTHGTK
jgi:hypothetical protein